MNILHKTISGISPFLLNELMLLSRENTCSVFFAVV